MSRKPLSGENKAISEEGGENFVKSTKGFLQLCQNVSQFFLANTVKSFDVLKFALLKDQNGSKQQYAERQSLAIKEYRSKKGC